MEQFVQELVEIHQNSSDNETVRKNMEPFLNKLELKYWEEAVDYYQKREEYNNSLAKLAEEKMGQLENLMKENGIQADIVNTSSLTAGLNLVNDSDIDITVLVDGLTPKLKEQFEKILDNFTCQGMVHGYYLFSQKTPDVEFEIKLRERDVAMPIIRLHQRMDQLTQKEKIIITYGKLLFHKTPLYYTFKMLVYNMYFADVEGCYMLD